MSGGNLLPKWFWEIIWYLFSCTSVDCACPVILLVGIITVVWFMDPVPDHAMGKIGQKSKNPLTHWRCPTLGADDGVGAALTTPYQFSDLF